MTNPTTEINARLFIIDNEIVGLVHDNIHSPKINVFNVTMPVAIEAARSLARVAMAIDVFQNYDNSKLADTVVNLVLNGNCVEKTLLRRGIGFGPVAPEFNDRPEAAKLRIVNKIVEGMCAVLESRGVVPTETKDRVRALTMDVYDDSSMLLSTGTGELLVFVANLMGGGDTKPDMEIYQILVSDLSVYYWADSQPTYVVSETHKQDRIFAEGSLDRLRHDDEGSNDSVPMFETTSVLTRNVREEFDVFVAGMDHVLDAIGLLAAERRAVRINLIHSWLVRNNYVPEVHDTLLLLLDKTEGK